MTNRDAGFFDDVHVQIEDATAEGAHATTPWLSTCRYSAAISFATVAILLGGRTFRRRASMALASSLKRRNALDQHSTSAGWTRMPSTPSRTSSAMPPSRDPITGTPAANASSITNGPVSNHWEGTANKS